MEGWGGSSSTSNHPARLRPPASDPQSGQTSPPSAPPCPGGRVPCRPPAEAEDLGSTARAWESPTPCRPHPQTPQGPPGPAASPDPGAAGEDPAWGQALTWLGGLGVLPTASPCSPHPKTTSIPHPQERGPPWGALLLSGIPQRRAGNPGALLKGWGALGLCFPTSPPRNLGTAPAARRRKARRRGGTQKHHSEHHTQQETPVAAPAARRAPPGPPRARLRQMPQKKNIPPPGEAKNFPSSPSPGPGRGWESPLGHGRSPPCPLHVPATSPPRAARPWPGGRFRVSLRQHRRNPSGLRLGQESWAGAPQPPPSSAGHKCPPRAGLGRVLQLGAGGLRRGRLR